MLDLLKHQENKIHNQNIQINLVIFELNIQVFFYTLLLDDYLLQLFF